MTKKTIPLKKTNNCFLKKKNFVFDYANIKQRQIIYYKNNNNRVIHKSNNKIISL
jgi:hypothetical protein